MKVYGTPKATWHSDWDGETGGQATVGEPTQDNKQEATQIHVKHEALIGKHQKGHYATVHAAHEAAKSFKKRYKLSYALKML